MSEENYTPIRTPEDVENLVKQCGGLKGEIVALHFDSDRIRLADGSYDWRPVCDRLSIRIFMEHPERTVEIAMSGMVLWKIGGACVSGAALESYCNSLNKLVLTAENGGQDEESYFIAYKTAWRFTENPRILADSDFYKNNPG